MTGHLPVLLSEVLLQLKLHSGDHVIDATLGGGGHTQAILEQTGPDGRLLGIEADPRTLEATERQLQTFSSRVEFVQGNFRQLDAYVEQTKFPAAAAILFDLGLSSITLSDPARGFSFQQDGPMDMRFDPKQSVTAADIVNDVPVKALAEVFRRLGEEPAADRIATAIDEARRQRPIERTGQLADIVSRVLRRRGKIHPATRVFQALRMAVNDELGSLAEALPKALAALRPGGRLAVISFHSVEDRLVKQWIKNAAAAHHLTIVTKHVVVPGRAEIVDNPRSRSAKLRVVEKRASQKT